MGPIQSREGEGAEWHSACIAACAVIDLVTQNIERYMDLLSARQKLVASNIANADTPGYKTKDLDFQGELESASASATPLPFEVGGLPVKNDGNDVSLDREARLLAENDMRFTIASNLIKSQIQTVKEAINGGTSA
jgi:flagellar basal-body rod protein FlgB